MDKLKFESPNLTDKNIEKIAALFPNVITEMKDEDKSTPSKTVYKKGANFELLRQELSGDVVDGEECYDFTWVGKKASIVEGNRPIRKTLRPCMEQSKNWEETGNLYIEGDNLDVLKLLQESYLNSVKMIYIDPPYNTGNDFIYKDNFTMDKDDYDEQIGLFDEDENRLFQNSESNGRFHSDWCSMLYPRLKLAQSLLTDDGVIFISIDDNEVENLKKICNEVFGESNFIAIFPWRKRTAKSDVPFGVSQDYEWVICYSKSYSFVSGIKSTGRKYFATPDFPHRTWRIHDLATQRNASERPNSYFDMINPKNNKIYPANPNSVWRITKDTFQSFYDNNRIIFPGDYEFLKNSNPVLRYFKDDDEKKDGKMFGLSSVSTNLPNGIGMTQDGTKDIMNLFSGKIFAFPKAVSLISYFIRISTTIDENSIILDFFSGSATTAHAVMQLNAEDGGNRKFIMVQLPEPCDEQSEAYKAGYKNICEIGKERIRRAGEKIKAEVEQGNAQLKIDEEQKKAPDIGFRVLKVDSTNMKDVYYSADEYNQTMLDKLKSNIKDDRTDLDLLYGVLLDWGLPLTLPHKIETINGVKVHIVDNGSLIACFADKVNEAVIREIAKRQPLRAVFRDSSFANSPDKINVEEIFKLGAPNTSVKVI
jgi:adenine-specific DNA-methyltransferase